MLSILAAFTTIVLSATTLHKRQLTAIGFEGSHVQRDPSVQPEYTITSGDFWQSDAQLQVKEHFLLTLDFSNSGSSDQNIKGVTVVTSLVLNSNGDTYELSQDTVSNINILTGQITSMSTAFTPTLSLQVVPGMFHGRPNQNLGYVVPHVGRLQKRNKFITDVNEATKWQFYNNARGNCTFAPIDTANTFHETATENESLISYTATASISDLFDRLNIHPQYNGFFRMTC